MVNNRYNDFINAVIIWVKPSCVKKPTGSKSITVCFSGKSGQSGQRNSRYYVLYAVHISPPKSPKMQMKYGRDFLIYHTDNLTELSTTLSLQWQQPMWREPATKKTKVICGQREHRWLACGKVQPLFLATPPDCSMDSNEKTANTASWDTAEENFIREKGK